MTLEYVKNLYIELEQMGIDIWIDGGWGVDALLGEQTRPHRDLDITIQKKDVERLYELMGARGYKEVKRYSEWNFVLGDDHGHEIDIHIFVFDENKHVISDLQYPVGSLSGFGMIDGYPVKCISPEHMVKFHTGYKLRDIDFKDVSALCDYFSIDYPEEYQLNLTSEIA